MVSHTFIMTVKAPDNVSQEEVLDVVRQIIEVGEQDAIESSENDEIDNPDADLATCIAITVNREQTV